MLSAYYDGELKEPLASDLTTHVAHCSACAGELRNFKSLSEVFTQHQDSLHTATLPVPTWDRLASRLDVAAQPAPVSPIKSSRRNLGFVVTAVLAASVLLWVSLDDRRNSESSTHGHDHSQAAEASVVIDFEKLLDDQSALATLSLDRSLDILSNKFEGREADVDESEAQLGYRPSISQALPSGVKLVSNRVLKLPNCNCAAGACSCGPAGCNCAASLCKRADGSEFLIVEHCATQNVSFGDLQSEVIRDGQREVQLIDAGTRLIASWIASNRRLTAIGLNDRQEAHALVESLVQNVATR
ncbi:MAG: zf-HC2 domain-containing protein [Pirellulaceae bacterium]|nr:zf-HC2 domain-containing protein [Pirellulaceae bacterium]